MTQLLCLKLYRLKLFIQVISCGYDTSKRTSFFYFFHFFKRTSGLHRKNLSNQFSNSSTNFGLGIKQPEF